MILNTHIVSVLVVIQCFIIDSQTLQLVTYKRQFMACGVDYKWRVNGWMHYFKLSGGTF